jgi:ATP-binding cassette subfamily B protein/subfamily B ATP-binding cassette protein MsbA
MTQKTPPPQADDIHSTGYNPQVMRELVAMIKPHWKPVLASILLQLFQTAVVVSGPYLIKIALDDGIATGSILVLRNSVLAYLGLNIVRWLSLYLRFNMMSRVSQTIIFDLRARLFDHMQALSINFFSSYSVGRIITRVINDVNVVREFVIWTSLAIFRNVFALIAIIVAMLSMNVRLSLMTFAVLPIMVTLTIIFRRFARKSYQEARTAISWVNSVLAENINAVRVVQSFVRENTNYSYFNQVVNQYNLDANLKVVRLIALFFPIVDFLSSIAMGLVIWLGGTAVLGQEITPGVLVAFVMYITRFFDPIRDLSQRYDSFERTMTSGERILGLLAEPVEVEDQPQAVEMQRISGKVHFDKVCYHYPSSDLPVLRDIDLHVEPGETVALVGHTGAGKSTLIKLLSRFIDPKEGHVMIDGQDLTQVTQGSLRSQMGIVLQDPFLFSDSVAENIRFGRLDASDEEVTAAALAVGAHDFIRNLRDGYDTQVGEGGGSLSEGQRQLVSFARALLADPRILVLDEATSSVDTQTEIIIQDALKVLLKDRTTFAIAHRLSTIINADRIVVLENGVITEQGTHEELLGREGIYHDLYHVNV